MKILTDLRLFGGICAACAVLTSTDFLRLREYSLHFRFCSIFVYDSRAKPISKLDSEDFIDSFRRFRNSMHLNISRKTSPASNFIRRSEQGEGQKVSLRFFLLRYVSCLSSKELLASFMHFTKHIFSPVYSAMPFIRNLTFFFKNS